MVYVRQVPQNIMTVELKIFDFMTLKQFGISVALIIISFLIYFIFGAFSPWNIIIPAVIIVVGGVVLFVPFNGEPFQEFISNYLEAVVSPQRRIWHKKGIILKTAADKARIYQYGKDMIGSVPLGRNMQLVQNNDLQTQEQSLLDRAEEEFLSTEIQVDEPLRSLRSNNYTPPVQKNPTKANTIMANDGTNLRQENRVNISQKTLFNSVKISNNNPGNQSNTANIGNTSIQAQQRSMRETIDDAAIKNYIFGSVEDYEDRPVENALVSLKRLNDTNVIEFIYTNEAGEFKTNSEYPKGSYVLQVVHNGTEFNTITIEHNPIDPQPVYIHPSDYDEYKLQQMQKRNEMSNEIKQLAEDGVFAGNYDASLFSFGSDYDDLMTSDGVSNTQQENNDASAHANCANRLDQNTQPAGTPQLKSDISHTSTLQYSTTNDEINGSTYHRMLGQDGKDMLFNAQNRSTHTANHGQNNVIHYFDFNAMPDVNLPIDPSLVNIPNALNGIIVGPGKHGVPGVLIQVFDKSGQLITSTISDHNGMFHSFSSLSNGDYVMYFSKNNQLLAAFHLRALGSRIPPKIIQFV